MDKKEIRQQIIRRRSELDADVWKEYTDIISEKVIKNQWFRESEDIFCYIDCKGETGTRLIIEEAWHLGKHVWVPKVLGLEMEFYRITSYDELVPGGFGILEPIQGMAASIEDACMIMPGTAFDLQRNRIGYGKGYYDKYLRRHPGIHTIAIAFDLQIVTDGVPGDAYDIRPQLIMTEARTLGEENMRDSKRNCNKKGDEVHR